MDSLLLLCRVDAFLVRGSGMFMHILRGCVRDCADCNCVGPAKSLHSVDWEFILAGCPEFFARTTESDVLPVCTPVKNSSTKGPHSLTPKEPHFCNDGKELYG
ncbi:unnamed protein product [Heligmosomoides polygyrus]|uniref:Secreted protein n=1 Tax=Heligmosomoides polygyrus TaxID=6339 RepID=A0A183GUY3_HELPZ|nr:unnamed protein product [Heligmosomoides polygyrus]